MTSPEPAARHAWAVDVLDVQPDDRLVDVGCGHGVTVSLVGALLGDGGRIVGLDRSARVIAMARKRNASLVDAGRAELVAGSFETVELAPGEWTKIYGFHVADFWRRPEPMLAAARRLLRPGGGLYLFSEIPAWERRWTAPALAGHVAGIVGANGFAVDPPIVGDLASGPVLCVRSRPTPGHRAMAGPGAAEPPSCCRRGR